MHSAVDCTSIDIIKEMGWLKCILIIVVTSWYLPDSQGIYFCLEVADKLTACMYSIL